MCVDKKGRKELERPFINRQLLNCKNMRQTMRCSQLVPIFLRGVEKKKRFRITNTTRPGNGLSSYGDNDSMVVVVG